MVLEQFSTKVIVYKSHVSYFYETEFEIWAGFGQTLQFRVNEFLIIF